MLWCGDGSVPERRGTKFNSVSLRSVSYIRWHLLGCVDAAFAVSDDDNDEDDDEEGGSRSDIQKLVKKLNIQSAVQTFTNSTAVSTNWLKLRNLNVCGMQR